MKQILVVLLLMSVIIIAGCTSTLQQSGERTLGDGTVVKSNGTMMEFKHSGTVLAGSSSPVLDFNKADYDKALRTDRLVVLYFYADWCPICRAEIPQLYSAFDELGNDSVVGFRINFNDGQTDNDEQNLARQFGVPYQHTKVFLKNGNSTLKSSETWDKNRYLLEINKALSI